MLTSLVEGSPMLIPSVIEKIKTPLEFCNLYGFSQNDANWKTKWLPSDTEERFDRNSNLKRTRRLLEEGSWTKDSILYTFNNYGFRTYNNFDLNNPAPGNMFLGCSITEGVGLNIENVWAYKINKVLGGAFYNLAQSGTGIETQYRLFKAWAPILKPKRAFTIGTFEVRREFIKNIGTLKVNGYTENSLPFLKRYLSCENEVYIGHRRVLDAIKMVAVENSIELYVIDESFHQEALFQATTGPWARDLDHLGPKYHEYASSDLNGWIRIV